MFGKNGLPYYLLMKIINIIDNLLQQIANFTIQFVEDINKKSYPYYYIEKELLNQLQ